jgi:hypothetical protein
VKSRSPQKTEKFSIHPDHPTRGERASEMKKKKPKNAEAVRTERASYSRNWVMKRHKPPPLDDLDFC